MRRTPTQAEGWLARTHASFPEQLIGRRFAVRGTHLHNAPWPGRITLTLDAGLAFGSGEHGSTRGCLRALERIVWRRPRRHPGSRHWFGDSGDGRRSSVASPRAGHRHRAMVGTCGAAECGAEPARAAGQGSAGGWLANHCAVRAGGPYDLVFANILARPLCLMARHLALHLAPGGTAIVSGLLRTQVRGVLAAHRRRGLRLETALHEDPGRP